MKFITDTSRQYLTEERCSIIEIINSINHPDVSIAQAKVAPGTTTADHSLQKTDEIYYILSGQGIAFLNKEEYHLKKGDALFIPKGSHQSIQNTGDTELIFLCICTPRFEQQNYISHE